MLTLPEISHSEMPKKKSLLNRLKIYFAPDRFFNSRIYYLLVILVTLSLIVLVWLNRDALSNLSRIGLFGIFAFNLLSYSTVFFPIPGVASVFFGGAIWNPFLVGIFSGIGASFGELFGYFLGFGSRGLVNKHGEPKKVWMAAAENFLHRAAFPTILICAFLPLPFDFLGFAAGLMGYPVQKFLVATLIGRVLRDIIIAITGAKVL